VDREFGGPARQGAGRHRVGRCRVRHRRDVGDHAGRYGFRGSDGWVAAFATNGTQRWLHQVGSIDDDLLAARRWPRAATCSLPNPRRDAVVIALSPGGQTRWQRQFGTADDDAGVGISAAADGTITVVGSTTVGSRPRGRPRRLRRDAHSSGVVQATRQFGTAADDGVDPFAESNLYLSGGWITGVTYGKRRRATAAGRTCSSTG